MGPKLNMGFFCFSHGGILIQRRLLEFLLSLLSLQDTILYNSPLTLYISVWLLLLGAVVSEIPLGSKLSVIENDLWLSSNGDFALGFFNSSDQPNQFSVGIRFYSRSIPVDGQTVVWVAGADAAVGNSTRSYFQLTRNGQLLLFDGSKGVTVWTTKTSQLSVASAVLGDNGNFVLLNGKKDIVWQSFDTPIDTLLPGQRLSAFKTLRAASTNPIASYYNLYMSDRGRLKLIWESSITYWSSGGPSNLNLSAVLSSNGTLQLLDKNLEPVWSVFGEDHHDSIKFRFLRLDLDGNLRLYSWVEVLQSWRSVWQAVENQCHVFATCGERGICVINASGFPECKCPFKYNSGCNSKCLLPSQCKSVSDWVEFEHLSLFGMYPTDDSISQSSLQQCKDMCLHDPQCSAVTFTNNRNAECRKITTQYVSGYSDSSVSIASFIKNCPYADPLAADPTFPMSSPPISPRKQSYRLCIPCVIGAASGTFVVFIVIHLVIGFWLYSKRKSIRRKAALSSTSPRLKGLIMLSFCEIEEFSENFKYRMGPKMFKGVLLENQPVAIKELDTTMEERKFRGTVLKIGNIHHKNLIKLEGYCCEFSHRYLVYEFATNGSVDRFMEDSNLCNKMTWKKRVDICTSVAKALCYLHTGCKEFVSHGNLKCEHVLLDENFEAKVTEYGIGIFRGEASFSRTSAGKDVEDFGKMVLVLVSGCREVENVCDWAYNEWMEGRPEAIVDKRIVGGVDPEKLERVLRIAFWCLQNDERMRPSMGEVLNVLEGTLTVDPPPPPFACRMAGEGGELSESSLESYSPTEH